MTPRRASIRIVPGIACVLSIVACSGGGKSERTDVPIATPAQSSGGFVAVNLVSNGVVASNHVDRNLVNPWGFAFAPNAPVWVVNNGSNTASIYDGTGEQAMPPIRLPAGTSGNSSPTSIVANTSGDFMVDSKGPASFITAGEGGTIAAWSPSNPTDAVTMYDAGASGAVYKGLAIANNGAENFLYATDFRNNKVDVFDKDFAKVAVPGGFADPAMPTGFAPFGIAAIGDQIYVTYAKQLAPENRDDVAGAGLGYVDVFDTDGVLMTRLASGGALNAPWGMAVAPPGFGQFGGSLLIANFGDGVINAFDRGTGAPLGSLTNENGAPIVIPGLWGIAFGNGAHAQLTNTLYFTAGPDDEQDGVYGGIAFVAPIDIPMPPGMPGY